MNAAVEAGWYADPENPTRWRWWDGVSWTEHTSEPVSPVDGEPIRDDHETSAEADEGPPPDDHRDQEHLAEAAVAHEPAPEEPHTGWDLAPPTAQPTNIEPEPSALDAEAEAEAEATEAQPTEDVPDGVRSDDDATDTATTTATLRPVVVEGADTPPDGQTLERLPFETVEPDFSTSPFATTGFRVALVLVVLFGLVIGYLLAT